MNPFQKALDEIQYSIPVPILNVAFRPNDAPSQVASLEYLIREAVIEPRVVTDLNLQGGTTAFIDLDAAQMEYVDPWTYVYYLKDEDTQNRTITQIYSLHYGILGYQNTGVALHFGASSMSSALNRVVDSALKSAPPSTSYLGLIGHNTIMVRYTYRHTRSAFIRCRLSYDDSLSEINPTTYQDFAQLCVTAVKAYIYNKMMIEMGQGQLSGGQTLGEFRSVVEGYADSNEFYLNGLKRFKKIALLNNTDARYRMLAAQVNP